MDFSKLDSNERLATYGAIAVVLAGLISALGGLLLLAILAALGVLVIVFLPQFSPKTSLPGSKGTLLAALGIVAGASALITLLVWIPYLGALSFNAVMFLVALVGALVMAWAGWQALQAEGGKWQLGAATATAPAPGANEAAPAAPSAAPSAEPSAPGERAQPAHDDVPAPAAPETDEPTDAEGRRPEA